MRVPGAQLDERLYFIEQILRDANADIVFLQETTGWDLQECKILKAVALHLNYPFYTIAPAKQSSSGFSYPVTILSRFQIRDFSVFGEREAFRNSAVVLTISSPIGDLVCANVHLSPKTESDRLREIHTLFSHPLMKQSENVLFGGDLNSLHTFDYPDVNAQYALVKLFNDTQRTKFCSVDGALDMKVTPYLEHAGFVDLVRSFTTPFPTVPTPFSTDVAHEVPLRIDYFYASPQLASRVVNVFRYDHDTIIKTSDHYPIIVDFA